MGPDSVETHPGHPRTGTLDKEIRALRSPFHAFDGRHVSG